MAFISTVESSLIDRFLTTSSSSTDILSRKFLVRCPHHHYQSHRRHNLLLRRRRYHLSVMASLELIVLVTVLIGVGASASEIEVSGGPLRYTITEQCDHGTIIGDLISDAGLRRRYPDDVISQLEFRIMSSPPLPFQVDLKSGVVRTGGVMDRDSLMQCKDKDLCEVNLDITIRPTTFFQIIKTIIQVDDINDNGPYFRDSQMTISIRESAAIDTSFSLPLASDLDSPKYGVVAYELMTDTTDLGLKVMDRGGRLMDVRLVVQKDLDRETRDEYRLQLVAYDGGPSPKSAQIDIVVHILDSNDHSPVFERSGYTLNITENIALGTVITRVRATDKDIGLNAEIVYSFSGQTQAMYGHLFRIRNQTGEILVTGDIDYEQSSIYQLAVIAEDRGPDSMPTDAAVVIRVQDQNDNPPSIVVSTLTARKTDTGEVMENLAPGTFVAHVSVLDRDSGDYGRVACNISDPSFNLVERYHTEHQVVTSVTFDRETKNLYEVWLVCWDGGLPPLVARKLIPVKILDANDHPPQFIHSTYTGRILENSKPEVPILHVKAIDGDVGANGEFHYALIHSGSTSAFDVNYDGSVVAKTVVDREQHSTFSLTVLAIDHGSPALTGTAIIIILVDDTNDEAPVFSRSSYSFSVPENQPEGTPVGRVSAEDRDLAPPDNAVHYSFISGHVTQDQFVIEPETGEILTTAALDREAQSVFRFTVQAVDRGDHPLSGSATVTIYVQDQNDHDPEFHFPSQNNDTISVSNRLPLGHVIAHVIATDPDLDKNGKVSYQILAGNDNGAFTIDSTTGLITLNIRLDHLDFYEYLLVLLASDGAIPRRNSETILKVQVNSSIVYVARTRNDYTVPDYNGNMLIVVLLVCGSSAASVTLLILIVIVWRRRYRRKKSQRYKCRMEALRALTAKELVGQGGSTEITPLTTISNQGNGQTTLKPTNGNAPVINNGDVTSFQTQSTSDHLAASDAEPDSIFPPSGHASNADSGNGHSEEEDTERLRATASSLPRQGHHPGPRLLTHRDFRFNLPPPPPPLITTYYTGRSARGGAGDPTAGSGSPLSLSSFSKHPPRAARLHSFTPSPEPHRWGAGNGRFCSPGDPSGRHAAAAAAAASGTVPILPLRSVQSGMATQSTGTEVREARPSCTRTEDTVTISCDDVIV